MKKCPKCELNYIKDDEELCSVCKNDKNIGPISFPPGVVINVMPDILVAGKNFGGNAKEIYRMGCSKFGWDPRYEKRFGMNGLMYKDSITKEGYDLWFITHNTNSDDKADCNWFTRIEDGGETLLEIWKNNYSFEYGKKNSLRVTFMLVISGNERRYVFYGLYRYKTDTKVEHNGKLYYAKKYERVNSTYPYKTSAKVIRIY